MINVQRHPASYKDPAGFLFSHEGVLYRQIDRRYAEHYQHLMNSGLYQELVEARLLLSHEELPPESFTGSGAFKILRPKPLTTISYPYEWCFDQLRDAGLATLQLCLKALQKGMILKDASAYNIQFEEGHPMLIDTLSFEKYDTAQPWIAYRQFCQHFLFPLYLEHYTHTSWLPMLSQHLDGLSAAATYSLLPWTSHWNLGVRLHVGLQAHPPKVSPAQSPRQSFNQKKMSHLLHHLQSILENLRPGYGKKSVWSTYYGHSISGGSYLSAKEKKLKEILQPLPKQKIIDLGTNEGHFAEMAAAMGHTVIALDNDPLCINTLYQKSKKDQLPLLPLVIDLSNPSPSLGFRHQERQSFSERIQGDLLLALALIHHLCISKNIPFSDLAQWLSTLAPRLILEFIPREDAKVQGLLDNREDQFEDYNEVVFEAAFKAYYDVKSRTSIPGSSRVIYDFLRKEKS